MTIIFIVCLAGTGLSEDHYERGFQDRSTLLTEQVADHYKPPPMKIGDPEKYYWPKVMARFEKYGTGDSAAVAWVEQLKYRSPFHFTLVGMARLLYRYRDSEVIRSNASLIVEKVFERRDNHNAWTSEGTENHLSMARTSGYLYAQHAIEAGLAVEGAREKRRWMERWIRETGKKILRYGTVEWNSSTYAVYNLIGWLNLYDYAVDEEIRAIARAVVDYYALELAVFYSWGAIGGAEMRGSGVCKPDYSASRYLCWLWFGSEEGTEVPSFSGSQYIQLMHAVTSAYRPPPALIQLARKDFDRQRYYRMSRPSYLYRHSSHSKLFYCIDSMFTLGSFAGAYGGWTGASSQIVPWKLCVPSASKPDPYQVSGNGLFYSGYAGKGLDPFTQVAQHENVLVQLTRVPKDAGRMSEKIRETVKEWQDRWASDFDRRFPGAAVNSNHVNRRVPMDPMDNRSYITWPPEAEIDTYQNGVHIITLGGLDICVQSVGDGRTRLIKEEGRSILINEAPLGRLCGFVLTVVGPNGARGTNVAGSLTTDGSGTVAYQAEAGFTMRVRFNGSGEFTEPIFDWGYGPVQQSVTMRSPPFEQPDWPRGAGFGRVPVVWIDGVSLPMEEPWPVYRGPGIVYGPEGFEVQVGGHGYRVDFSGAVPQVHITHQEASK